MTRFAYDGQVGRPEECWELDSRHDQIPMCAVVYVACQVTLLLAFAATGNNANRWQDTVRQRHLAWDHCQPSSSCMWRRLSLNDWRRWWTTTLPLFRCWPFPFQQSRPVRAFHKTTTAAPPPVICQDRAQSHQKTIWHNSTIFGTSNAGNCGL